MYSHVYSLDLHNVIMHRSVYLYQAEAPICFLVAVCSEPYHPHNNVGVVNSEPYHPHNNVGVVNFILILILA